MPGWVHLHRSIVISGWILQIIGFITAMFINQVSLSMCAIHETGCHSSLENLSPGCHPAVQIDKFSAVPHAVLGTVVFALGKRTHMG